MDKQTLVALAVGAAVTVFLFILKWSPKPKPYQKHGFVENPEILEKAEELSNQTDTSGFVPLSVFDSDKGYSESYVLDLVSFLETNGVDAIYTKTVLAIYEATISRFYLSVSKEQVEKAKELLQQKQSETL